MKATPPKARRTNRTYVEPEFAPAHRDAGRVDEGRHDKQEDKLGDHLNSRQARRHRENKSYENQQNCRGDFDTVCGNGDRCHGYKNENQEKMYVHVLG